MADMTLREAAIELKRRGWKRRSAGDYIPPEKMRGVPRTGLRFREACSFEGISFEPNSAPEIQRQEGKP